MKKVAQFIFSILMITSVQQHTLFAGFWDRFYSNTESETETIEEKYEKMEKKLNKTKAMNEYCTVFQSTEPFCQVMGDILAYQEKAQKEALENLKKAASSR